MDQVTVYLQQLAQFTDILKIQRNTVKAMMALAHTIFGGVTGGQTFFVTLPDPTLNPNGLTNALPGFGNATNMTLNIPPLAMYDLAQVDPNTWSDSALTADTTELLIQGIKWGSTSFIIPSPVSATRIDIIEGKINTTEDIDNVVLPYYPLIQTVTIASGSHSVTKAYVTSHDGMTAGSPGDPVILQGHVTGSGPTTFIQTKGTDGGGNYITVSPAWTVAPSAGGGETLRDISPNNGNPLAGKANSGLAQPTSRVRTLTLQRVAGAEGGGIPSLTAGFTAICALVIPAGATTLNGTISYGSAPVWPGLIGNSHHSGGAGQSSKVNIDTELTVPAVKRTGDSMTGNLIVVGNDVKAVRFNFEGVLKNNADVLPNDITGGVMGVGSGELNGEAIFYKANDAGVATCVNNTALSTRKHLWRCADNRSQKDGIVDFVNSANDGWIEFPNGLVLQWGVTGTASLASQASASFAVTLPLTLNTVYQAFATVKHSAETHSVVAAVSTMSISTLNLKATNYHANTANTVSIMWVCIGLKL
jgi:hypothetical protein